ncbi:MAG: hypothetical protein EHM63_01845 [Actinobacteria bacterium]|nr:MAG: hypothetical protein EHM63_01845 [Actinomycetota bacterium]
MTALQWVAVAFGLALIALLLGLAVFIAFARADRQLERRRAMGKHPSRRDPDDPWDSDPWEERP